MSSNFIQPVVLMSSLLAFVYCSRNQPGPNECEGITPEEHTVPVKRTQVRVCISDTLTSKQFDAIESDINSYKIYLYVQSLWGGGWFRQNPTIATKRWQAGAYLGGKGQHLAKDNEVFQLKAVLTEGEPPEEAGDFTLIKNDGETIVLPKTWSITVRNKD